MNKKTVFVVDDSELSLHFARKALGDAYRVLTMNSAEKLFKIIEKIHADIILLDIEMPDANGFDVIKQLRQMADYVRTPVVFITSHSDEDTERKAFESGAADFIVKPYTVTRIQKRVESHLRLAQYHSQMRTLITERTGDYTRLQSRILTVVADIVESRDYTTGGHITRTMAYLHELIREMQRAGVYAQEMSKWDIPKVLQSSQLHDIGKIAISDTILNKPGKLTEDEFRIMSQHTTLGVNIINRISEELEDGTFLAHAKKFAAAHHERLDGTGYPNGLVGHYIPLEGRILAIVDVYDALVSKRPYKEPFAHSVAVNIIKQGASSHFDPQILDVFLQCDDKIRTIAEASNRLNETGDDFYIRT